MELGQPSGVNSPIGDLRRGSWDSDEDYCFGYLAYRCQSSSFWRFSRTTSRKRPIMLTAMPALVAVIAVLRLTAVRFVPTRARAVAASPPPGLLPVRLKKAMRHQPPPSQAAKPQTKRRLHPD